MTDRSSGRYRRPAHRSRAVQAQATRLRTEREVKPRRVDATVAPDGMALRARASAVLFLFLLGWSAIALRAGYLSVGPDQRLSDRLAGQQSRVISVAPQRGSIVDRLGRPLAVSIELDSVFADPSMVEDPAAAAELLAQLLDRQPEELLAQLSRTDTRFTWLARQVSEPVAEAVRSLDIPGVRLTAEPHRQYPSGPLAGAVLGFVGTEGRGLEGLEARFDDHLMGDTIQYRILRDGRRRPVNHEAVLSRRSTEGSTIVLTLDHSIQHRAEIALEQAIELRDARGGQVVVLDARNGAVLAMVSAPSFDPNHFRGVEASRFQPTALSTVYEPGSTMKAFVIAEVLERGLATAEESLYCEKGAYRIGRRTVHDTHSYDTLTVAEILQVSSNIGVSKLGERIGPQGLEDTYRRFGFGRTTRIELREEVGILHKASTWSRIGFATHTFGQGMAVTGMQLAAGFAALVNGGLQVQPHLVAEVRDVSGAVVEERRKEPGERVLSEAVSHQMRGLLGLVVEEGGTGRKARLKEYSSGGKTGTAQKVKDGRYARGLYVSSYIGFAPRDDPRIVVLAVLDEPRKEYYGGTVAGPIFRSVATHALRELGVPPDDALPSLIEVGSELADAGAGAAREELPATDATAIELLEVDEGWEMPDLEGRSLRDVVSVLSPLGIDLKFDGSGLVHEQEPAAGETLAPDGTVRLALRVGAPTRKKRK